jgi:hypothetical protein
LHGENIVAQDTQAFNDGVAEILVGVEVGHACSSPAIQPDFLFDLLGMLFVVGEG